MKFAANLTMLWPELPYLDRFDAAAEAGFEAVEVLNPYDVAAPETQAALGRNRLELILINAPPPNYTGGARGFSATVGGEKRFQMDMRRALRYATAFGAKMIHVISGDGAGDAAKDTLISNMKWAAEVAPKDMTLLLEPLTTSTNPGYFMCDYALAAEVLETISAPNLALQFDSFHAQMIHGDAVAVYQQYHPLIRHIQIGDTPDRSAPGTGGVDFDGLFAAIVANGYTGWISGEYHPGITTEDTLGWMRLA